MLVANKKSPLLYQLNKSTINPFEYNYGQNIGYGYKQILVVFPKLGPNSVYNKRFVFELPRNGLLAAAYFKFSLTCTGDNTQVEDRLGSRVFSSMSLETIRGPNRLQRVDQLYTNARIDNLHYNLYTNLVSCMEPSATFNNTTVTCYAPCFFYFSDDPSLFIDTDKCEPLQITANTGANKEAMGLPADLTGITCELHLTYFKGPQLKQSLPKTLLTYDAFHELPQTLASGATSVTFRPKFRGLAFNMHLFCVSSTQEFLQVESFKLYSGSEVLVDCDRRINFNMWSSETYNNITGAFTYWFSLYKSRQSQQLSLNFRDLSDCSIVANFSATPSSSYSFYVVFEYFSLIDFNRYGFINRSLVY